MKKAFSIIGIIMFTTITLITSIIFNACKKDESKNCDRTCYYGKWDASDIQPGDSHTYTVTITASAADPNEINIDGFGYSGAIITAAVDNETFSVPFQMPYQNESFEGSGTLSEDGKTIDVVYEAYGNEDWTGTWTKQ